MLKSTERSCLQISISPADFRFAEHTLPHQMRVLSNQVDEVQFTLDARQRRTSRWAIEHFDDALHGLQSLLRDLCSMYENASVVEIDFSNAAVDEISRAMRFKGRVPLSAYSGGPFYGYLFGLYRTQAKYVFHLDSDMLIGGGSSSWIAEAIGLLKHDRSIFVVNPLAGPPTTSGQIFQRSLKRLDLPFPAYTANTVTTRVFLGDRSRLLFEYDLPIVPVKGVRRIQAFVNNVPGVYELEICLSKLMSLNGLVRLDMLGTDCGLWSLHPLHRSETFYRRLPELVRMVESGDVPEAQRGHYNINDSMVDWSDVRRKSTILSKLRRYYCYATSGLVERTLGK